MPQEQYIFIHDAIFEVVLCGDTQIDAGNFHKCFNKISKGASGTHADEFQNQFMVCIRDGHIAVDIMKFDYRYSKKYLPNQRRYNRAVLLKIPQRTAVNIIFLVSSPPLYAELPG